jgi:6-phosphogluconolactonase
MRPRIHCFHSQALLVDALRTRIATLAAQCCADKGRFRIVLSGGTTPQVLYQRLRTLNTDWSCWHIYFGDERYLPIGDPQRNDTMAAAAWLDHVDLPAVHIHTVPYLPQIQAAAAAYSAELAQVQGFDLVLLGLGEDGHTASLFPGDACAAGTTELALAVINAPKPPPQRVSMSARSLSNATAVWCIVTGDSKRSALQDWLNGVPTPIQTIRPQGGVDVYTDLNLPITEETSND